MTQTKPPRTWNMWALVDEDGAVNVLMYLSRRAASALRARNQTLIRVTVTEVRACPAGRARESRTQVKVMHV